MNFRHLKRLSLSEAGLLRTCPDLGPEELQQALTLNLSEQARMAALMAALRVRLATSLFGPLSFVACEVNQFFVDRHIGPASQQ